MLKAPAAGALLAALLAPGIAEAQLFPNLPTRKRERADCSQELPVYGVYRQKFYGYYPTCWRQFPDGWGCPSPESPNWQAELARQPLDIPEEGDLGGLDDFGGGLGGPDPFGAFDDEELPGLPGARSPFELDEPPGGAPSNGPRGRQPSPFDLDSEAPGAAPEIDPRPPSPFDLPESSALPGIGPPVTGLGTSAEPLIPMGSDPGPIPELASIPEVRSRPFPPSPFDRTSPTPTLGRPIPSPEMPAGMTVLPGLGQPLGVDLPGATSGDSGPLLGEFGAPPPGVFVPGTAEESLRPIDRESRPRPVRRLISGLFGRGERR